MNLLLFSDDDIDATRPGEIDIRIRDSRLAHLNTVLRSKPGDTVRCGRLHDQLGQGQIIAIDTTEARLRVNLTMPPPAPLPHRLVVALPRPKMLRRIVRDATCLGFKEIHFLGSYLVDKAYWQSPLLAAEQLDAVVRDALSQAMDTIPPHLSLHRHFKPFLEDTLPGLPGTRYLASPGPANAAPSLTSAGPITLIIGPERGFTAYEIERLRATGAVDLHLGTRVLRVDTAVAAIGGLLLATSNR